MTDLTPKKADGIAGDGSGAARFFRTLMLGPTGWRRWWRALVRQVEHEKILQQVQEDASFSFNFVFMIVIAGGIATIGLLLNSPAVIIGAMLISPLMGPIVAGGIALAMLDVELARKSLGTLGLGTIWAIAFTALIVWVSPVKDLTPELLARTRPNLFDLIVAILSGAAGGYAMIRGRGGAIVGVAIATALMPPLAAIGFGIATQNWAVTRGALLLFVTNMAAISLTVAAVAAWYGFGTGGLRKRFAYQAAISLVVLAPLAVPLFLSLKAIAFESLAQASIRSVLETGAAKLPEGQVGEVNVTFLDNKPLSVRAVLFSAKPDSALANVYKEQMEHDVGSPVDLRLIQILATGDTSAQILTEERVQSQRRNAAEQLRNAFALPLVAFDANTALKTVTLVPGAQPGVDLVGWRSMEGDIARRFTDWTVEISPPPQSLPPIRFALGEASLDATAHETIDTVVWALKRWKSTRVQLVGHASNEGNGSMRLARARALRVTEVLRAQGVTVDMQARYPMPNQLAVEREWGFSELRSVSIALPLPAAAQKKDY